MTGNGKRCRVRIPRRTPRRSGTADDPDPIATAPDPVALGKSPEDRHKTLILTAGSESVMSHLIFVDFKRAAIAPDADAVESGLQGISFTGVFDENGRRYPRCRRPCGRKYVLSKIRSLRPDGTMG